MSRKCCRGDPLHNMAGRISSGANSPKWTNKSGLPGTDKRWEEHRSLQPTRPLANANLCYNQNAIHFPSDDCSARAGPALFIWLRAQTICIDSSFIHCWTHALYVWMRRKMGPITACDASPHWWRSQTGRKRAIKGHLLPFVCPPKKAPAFPRSSKPRLAPRWKIRHQHSQIRGPIVLLTKSFQQPKTLCVTIPR